MIGSSNLTQNGLSFNVERSLFVVGQRHTEPFSSIETQLETFRTQAYPFNDSVKKVLERIEKFSKITEEKYLQELVDVGLRPKPLVADAIAIPVEVQQGALEALEDLMSASRLEYSYQMLLLLVMLERADNDGAFSLNEAAICFSRFYELRVNAGLPVEKSYKSKSAEVETEWSNIKSLKRNIRINPFPRFERRGLLDLSEDRDYFIINPALRAGLTNSLRSNLRVRAIDKLAAHYVEDRQLIEEMVTKAIG